MGSRHARRRRRLRACRAGMARREPRRRVRAATRSRRARQRARVLHRAPRLEPAHGRGRLDLPGLAVALRRTRCDDESAHHLPQGVRPGQRTRPREPPRRRTARADADRVRHRGAETALPARHRQCHRTVGAGLFRAGSRLRPRRRRDDCTAGRRQVGHQRPEDLDVVGAPLTVGLRHHAQRAGLAAPRRTVVPARAARSAGRHDPPDPAAHRHLGVQ